MNTRDHDAVLDGLRGFAAIAVLVYHLGHWFRIPGLASNSGLAVDFFFCLSGYVLAMVYSGRLDRGLGLKAFLTARAVRLMPMIAAGTIISATYAAFRLITRHEAGDGAIALATVLGLVDLPYLHAPDMIGGPQVFPLNGPQYSLFLEIVVNAAWACAPFMRGRIASVGLATLGIAGVAVLGLGGDETGTFVDGFPRVFGSFYLGVLAHAAAPWVRRNVARTFAPALLTMVALFLFPLPLPTPIVMAWIAVLSPIIVATGSGVRLPARLRPAALLLGRLSFPIYALHYPLFCWINGMVQMATHRQIPAIEIPLVLVAVPLLSWLALVRYDEPLRQRLSQRGRNRRSAPRPSAETVDMALEART